MSWGEFLSSMLEATSKVEKAAIFSTRGLPLATTEDLQISEADGRALLNCLMDPARCLTRIRLDGMDFRCFQGNSTALIGKATTDPSRVLVARLTDDALVMVIGNSTGHGSFLYEIQYHLEEHARRQTEQASNGGAGETSQAKVQTPLPTTVLPPPGSVGQGDVLLQLHD
ncbi:hypothetical protein ACOMHN_000187 [Nucella lapillus]